MAEPTAILTELKYIENKVCKVLGKEPMEAMNNAEMAKFNLRNATEITDFHSNDNCVVLEENRYDDDGEFDSDDALLDQLLLFMQKGDNKAVEKVKKVMEIAEQSRG
jgi:hypothetical protein